VREHKMLADQERIKPAWLRRKQIVMRAQAGLADRDTMVGILIVSSRSFGTDGQSLQVAIVHPGCGRRGERPVKFSPSVNLQRAAPYQSSRPSAISSCKLLSASAGNNQEKTVGRR